MSAPDPVLLVVDALRANGHSVIERGDKYSAQCPSHDDNSPSLSVGPRSDGQGAVVYCHAGCDYADVLAAIGLSPRDLFTDNEMRSAFAPNSTYVYPDGRRVHRSNGKKFRQSGDTQGRALFHADRIGDSPLAYVCEGEKDCLAIEAAGGTAVCSAMGAGKARKADWSPLTGLDVIVVADKDEPGRKHATAIVELLAGKALSVRVMEAKAGKDAADHVAAGYALHELVPADNDHDEPPATAAVSIDDAHAAFIKWLGKDYDTDALDAVLATAAVERLDGDPLWLLLISGSGNAKTETVQALEGIGAIITSTISSEGALLSATPKRERAQNATGGLLRKLEPRGVLVIKDVTSVLSMSGEDRAKVLAALREVYDGRWARNVGTDGGLTLEWAGRTAVIGAVTTAWDKAHAAIASMGDRFVLVRMDSSTGRQAAGRKAIGNTGAETLMRAELVTAIAGVIAGMNATPITVTAAETDVLLAAADLVTLARTGVEYDYRGDVIDAHAPEMPTRFAKQLAQVVRGGVAIGMQRQAALRLAIRCARDSMPPLRLAIIDDVAASPASPTADIRRRLGKPRATVDRQLQALHMLGVLDCDEVEEQRAGRDVTRWYYRLADGIAPTALDPKSVPDLAVHTPSPHRSVGEMGEVGEPLRVWSAKSGTGFSAGDEPDEPDPEPSPVGLFDTPSRGEECACGNSLQTPDATNSGRCKPCRDKMMAGYDQ